MKNKSIYTLFNNQTIRRRKHKSESHNICRNSPTYVLHTLKYLIHKGGSVR